MFSCDLYISSLLKELVLKNILVRQQMAVKAWRKKDCISMIWPIDLSNESGAVHRVCCSKKNLSFCTDQVSVCHIQIFILSIIAEAAELLLDHQKKFCFYKHQVQDDIDVKIQSFCFWDWRYDGFVTSLLSLDFRFQLNIGNSSCSVSSKFREI